MNAETGKWIILTGIIIIVVGAVIYFFHDKLHWLGRLPGDIRVEKGNTRFYFPVTTLIIISVLLTVIVNLIKRFFH
jgi:H+/Cl- antiporter ClcA